MAAAAIIPSELRRSGTGRVRHAHHFDLPEVARLFARIHAPQRPSRVDLISWIESGTLLILDDELTVRAVALVETREGHGQLALLVVEPGIPGLEERMVAVADALCVALGRGPMEIVAG